MCSVDGFVEISVGFWQNSPWFLGFVKIPRSRSNFFASHRAKHLIKMQDYKFIHVFLSFSNLTALHDYHIYQAMNVLWIAPLFT